MEMMTFKNCKCSIPKGHFDANKIPLDCPKVWRLFASGRTNGVFQLETKLGQEWAAKVKPQNIEEISTLISLIRPGTLESGLSEKYVDIKFGKEQISYLHPSLEPILSKTNGVMVYQEQLLQIATALAQFNLEDADALRTAVGKKNVELMGKLKPKFINGCLKNKITADIAEEIFSWIEKSQRYSFNHCLSGDTKIRSIHGSYTIEHMYKIKNDANYAVNNRRNRLRQKWHAENKYFYGFSMNEKEEIVRNKIVDIRPAGVQALYRITLKNGYSVRATANHKFPTNKGEKTVKELREKDLLYIANPVALCEIVSINKSGVEETYDVTMDEPYHNFVVNDGIVTCNSHAVSYAMLSYITAWIKCHFPYEFFTSWLTYSSYKTDPKEEIYKLVQDAKFFNIPVYLPDIRRGNVHFAMTDTPAKGISFGLSHIRGVGPAAITKITKVERWKDFLQKIQSLHRNVAVALIKAGACDCYNISRARMIQEVEAIFGTSDDEDRGLTEKEKGYLFDRLAEPNTDLLQILTEMTINSSKKKLSQMTKKELVDTAVQYFTGLDDKIIDDSAVVAYSTENEKMQWIETIKSRTKDRITQLLKDNCYDDTVIKSPCANNARREKIAEKITKLEEWPKETSSARAAAEKHFLGIPISCSAADDIIDNEATHTCLELAHEDNDKPVSICVIIDDVKQTKTTKGNNPGSEMCFLTVSDSTYSINHAVVFPDAYETLKPCCQKDLVCLIKGTKKKGSFIVSDIEALL